MYKVFLNGQVLYYPGDDQAAVLSPQLNLQTGYAGEFECDVPASNPLYDRIKNRSSMVSVYRDKKELFYGEVKTCQKNRWNDKNIYCTGALSFLSDTIQPQAEYHDMSPRQMLETFLNIHNDQVEERKQIKIGIVTIHDSNDSLYRYTNFETTLEAIRDKLVDRLGGYLRLRHEPNGLYLDWITLAEYGKYCSQTIEFGENLLDYSENLDSTSLITALIPLGARIEQEGGTESDANALEKYTDITSVNEGSNCIYSEEAVAAFGWVCGVNHWDDVGVPSNLLKRAEEYLADNQFEQLTLELSAIDLSLMDRDYEAFDCGDRIHCRAKPYGMDRAFPVMELSIPLAEPENATLKLGETKTQGLTGEVSSSVARVEREAKEREYEMSDWLGSAIDNATQMMTGQKGGYKLSEFDEEGRWLRDLYMDAPVKEDATNIMQVNPYGIGFSRTGYEGPYLSAWTIDGTFLGEFIKAHSIQAEALSTEYTDHVEVLIEDAETGAKEYADDKVTTSVKSLEGQITLAVDTERTRASGVEETLSSRIQVNQEGITSEVSRAKGVEESLGSRITQTESSITSEISRAQGAESSLGTRITQTADAIDLCVKSSDFTGNNIISKINLSSTTATISASKVNINASDIRLQSTSLSWSSTYSSMTSAGVLKCSGADITGDFRCNLGQEFMEIKESVMRGGYGSTRDGLLDLSAQYTGGNRDVVLEAITYNLRLKANKSLILEVGGINIDGYTGYTGTVNFANEHIKLAFHNGIITTVTT